MEWSALRREREILRRVSSEGAPKVFLPRRERFLGVRGKPWLSPLKKKKPKERKAPKEVARRVKMRR